MRTFGPVLDAEERVTQVFAYGQEITELKKAEEGLRKAHDELQGEVEVRRRAEKELRRALATCAGGFRDAVTSGIAHRDGLAVTGGGKGKTVVHRAEKTGRNDPCPCGSGKKFKKCCLRLSG